MKKAVSYIISALVALGLFTASAVMAAAPVSAYIDPSVTTYAIQAVAGVAVAVGAVAAVFWRKAKKKVTKTLHIDENANKEVEEDIVVFDKSAEDSRTEEK